MVENKIILKAKKDLRYPEDVCDSIVNGMLINLLKEKPTLKVSTESNKEDMDRENKEFSIHYTEDIKESKRRATIFSKNEGKIHAIIIEEFCTDLMVDKLREDPNFDTILTDDHTKLLKKIKEIMYSLTDATNPFWSLSETLGRFLNMKQASHETLYAYKDRFCQESSMKVKLGNDVLKYLVKSTEKYANETDSKVKQEMVDGAMDQFTAMCYLRGCDHEQYQSLMDNLRSQYTGGNDQYPETVDKAMTILSKNRIDNRMGKNSESRSHLKNKDGDEKEGEMKDPTSFIQDGKKKCYCCGSSAHVSPDCPVAMNRPKEEWVNPSKWRPKYLSNLQDGDESQLMKVTKMIFNLVSVAYT
ncbi:MAG: hypothetical protein SGBAC_010712 [Bacillariaceae sp.]